MIVISSVVRFWQEYRSAVAVVKLQNSVRMDVKVRRPKTVLDKGFETLVASEVLIHEKELVPGDILVLSPGDNVPADCVLLESTNLQISQSSLTGESYPVKKSAHTSGEKHDDALFDLENVVFMGTSVISGTGVALVARTGDSKYFSSVGIRRRVVIKNPFSSGRRIPRDNCQATEQTPAIERFPTGHSQCDLHDGCLHANHGYNREYSPAKDVCSVD